MPSASWGRTSLYSWRKRSSARCCLRRLAAGGWATSCFSVRCIRSCLPFCSGCPASMRSGTMPSLIHHTAKRDSPARARVANGAPLSVRMAAGMPYSRNAASKMACTRAVSIFLHRLAAQQIPAVRVGDGQRIDALSVGGAEPALEIRAPHAVGSIGMRQRLAIRGGAHTLSAWHHQTFALQQRTDGAGRGPASPGLIALQNVLELPRSPAHMRLPQLQHLLLDLLRHLVVMPVRGAAVFQQPGCSRFAIPL